MDDDMKLPIGNTCTDCAFYSRCKWLFGCDPDNTECDWAPSRFKLFQKSGEFGRVNDVPRNNGFLGG